MRIAYLCLQGTSPGQGSYTHVREIVRDLQARGYVVTLYEPKYLSAKDRPGPVGRLVRMVLPIVRAITALPTSDVLYVRSHFAALPVILVAAMFRRPVVQELNGPYEDLFAAWPGTNRIARLLYMGMRLQLRLATRVIAVTPELASLADREGKRSDTTVIGNGVDADRFFPRPSGALPVSPPRAIFVGVLASYQGVEEMLAATDEPAWPSDVRLTIAGSGPLTDLVTDRAASSARIEYLGSVPFTRVPDLLRWSSVALCIQSSSPRNTVSGLSPIKLFEAMASGIPLIVADVGGVAEFVRATGCGLVVPTADPAAIARAVRTLAEDPGLAEDLGRHGRDAAVAEHTWHARAQATGIVIQAAVENP